MNINLNYDIFKSKYNENLNCISQYENEIIKIRKIIDDISTIWKDSDYLFFQTQMQKYLTELSEFKEQLNSFNEYMIGYSISTDTLDNTYKTKKITIE